MISFEINTENAVIASNNHRIEKHGQEKALAVDIDIKADMPCDIVKELAIGNAESDWIDDIFEEEDGSVKSLGINKIIFDREYEEHTAEIEIDSVNDDNVIVLTDVKVKKFAAIPTFGKLVKLSFQIQCKPDDEQLVFLSHAITKNSVKIRIIKPEQMDLIEEDKEQG